MRALLLPLLALLAACSQEIADEAPMPSMTWTVEEADSLLTFVTVKNGDLDEEHELTGLSGFLTEDGEARIELAMASVETFIPIRNERLAEHLFQTAEFPIATVTADLDYAAIAPDALGSSHEQTIDFTLTLRGIELPLSAEVRISWVEDGLVTVETVNPVIVDGSALDLLAGIETLRGLAGLESIESTIAVSFALSFRR